MHKEGSEVVKGTYFDFVVVIWDVTLLESHPDTLVPPA